VPILELFFFILFSYEAALPITLWMISGIFPVDPA